MGILPARSGWAADSTRSFVWDFPGEGDGVVVGDNIKITIDAELVLQPEPSKGG